MANKKMNKKFLPKVGSTVAVAVAMSVALSTQVNATGLDDDNLPPSTPQNQTPGSQQDQTPEQINPVETNNAIEQENNNNIAANQEVTSGDEQIHQDNLEKIKSNAEQTKGELADPGLTPPVAPGTSETPDVPVAPETPEEPEQPVLPDVPEAPTEPTAPEEPEAPTEPTAPDELEVPDASQIPERPVAPDAPEKPVAPEAPTEPTAPDDSTIPEKPTAPEKPNTDGMTVDEHNAEANEYNEAAKDYNEDAKEYNDAVQDYNGDVNDYNEDVKDYNEDVKDYNEDVKEYEEDAKEYNDKAEEYNTDKAEDYNDAVTDYNTKVNEYNDQVDDYNTAVDNYNTALDNYKDQVEDYNSKVPGYNEDVEEYNDKVKEYNDKADAYEQAIEAYNNAVVAYNTQVAAYLTDVTEYNQKVEAYNIAAQAYDEAAKQKYLQDMADFAAAQQAHTDAVTKYNTDTTKQQADKKADAAFSTAKASYDQACAEYQAALADYEESLADGAHNEEAKKNYHAQKELYDAAHAAYQQAVKAYDDALIPYAPVDEAAQEYMDDGYVAALNDYNTKLATYKTGSKEYQDYLTAKITYDADYAAYLDALYAYNTGDLAEYLEKVEQAQKENKLLDEVNKYNNSVTDYNNQQAEANNALQSGVDGVVDGVGKLDETNQAVSDAFDAAKMAILNDYENRKAAVQTMAAALDTHPGKDAELGSAAYADYLADIEKYNKAVDAFNTFVREQYNPAVTAYNTAVDNYVPPVIPSAPSSGNGVQQGSGAAVNWGNINTQTVNHVDVKYASAASKTVTKDENGNVISSSDTVTHYTVTGVYTSEAAAEGGQSTDYAVNFDNDGSGTQAPDVQLLHKSSEYAEFGSDRSGYAYHQIDGGTLNQDETYYIESNEFGSTHQEIVYNAEEESWGYYRYSWSGGMGGHGGMGGPGGGGWEQVWESVDLDSTEVFERGSQIAINPATGTISFYATVTDDKGQTHGLNVSLDANSVYANGSYYKAQFKTDFFGNETESDFLNRFVIEGENGEEITIPVVMIDGEKYYDISGQSVFLISALTCDGMTEYNRRLTPNGLDLVLNVQTMIEVHRAASPKKLAYKTYDLQKYKPARQATNPDEIPDPSNDLKKPELDDVQLSNRPTDPILKEVKRIDKTEPTAPTPTARLSKIETETLQTLDKKVIIEFADLTTLEDITEIEDSSEFLDPVDYLAWLNIAPTARTIEEELDDLLALEELKELETLDTVDFVDYMNLRTPTVTPPVTPPTYEPVPLNDDFEVDFEIEIPDEEVPLAAAPKTGDISTLWGLLSGFSAAGMALLGRKRKDEE